MTTVIRAQRRSNVLTPSSLACLSRMPTVNLTAGCAIGCVYCYGRGYTAYPGDGKVILYENTLEKLMEELSRKRTMSPAVYFSPSSDLFQPVPEVVALGHSVLEFLLSKGVAITILTKGRIPDNTMDLLLSHAAQARVQVGITTLDEGVLRMFEPGAPPPTVRLEQMARLAAGGINVEARIDPILPGLSDTSDVLESLFAALYKAGVRRAAASILFLRPRVVESLKRCVTPSKAIECLLQCYADAPRLALRAESSTIVALPRATREAIFERVCRTAGVQRIQVSICACKNPDIAGGTCGISGHWLKQPAQVRQPGLFEIGE